MRQGELYWVDFGEPVGSEPGFERPAVVVQNDAANETGITTVVICPITSTVRRARPGRVVLEAGQSGLQRPSVVEVWSPMTVSRQALGRYIGRVDSRTVREMVRGIFRYLEPMG